MSRAAAHVFYTAGTLALLCMLLRTLFVSLGPVTCLLWYRVYVIIVCGEHVGARVAVAFVLLRF